MSPPLSELSPDHHYSSPDGFEQYYDSYSTLVVPSGAASDFYTSENLYLWQDTDGIYHWADASVARSDGSLAYPHPSHYASAFTSEAIQLVRSHRWTPPLDAESNLD